MSPGDGAPVFSPAVVTSVIEHMNTDHGGDNLLIAQAFGSADALGSTMTGLDEHAGRWVYSGGVGGVTDLRIPWSAQVGERSGIRREIVALYELACARMNVAPRSGRSAEPAPPVPFSTSLRQRTRSGHWHSAGHGFMHSLTSDSGTLERYAALVVQHYFLYEALDAAAARVIGDPQARGFITDRLARVPALEADLVFLLGPEWRDAASALPATRRYIERITQVADEGWTGGVIAHHYTRYLGDLSGGQMIRTSLQDRFGLAVDGVRFYSFAEIPSAADFVAAYRQRLDALDWHPDEQERVIDEVRAAYAFNSEMFTELASG